MLHRTIRQDVETHRQYERRTAEGSLCRRNGNGRERNTLEQGQEPA